MGSGFFAYPIWRLPLIPGRMIYLFFGLWVPYVAVHFRLDLTLTLPAFIGALFSKCGVQWGYKLEFYLIQRTINLCNLVPGARIELARDNVPRDFKSLVSTYSTTQALGLQTYCLLART